MSDEFGYSFGELLAKTWAPRGQRPVLPPVKGERRVISNAVALSLWGSLHKRCFRGGMKSPEVIRFLKQWLPCFPGGFILIWDRARIHTSGLTQTFLSQHPQVFQEYLPPYALNSIPKSIVMATSNSILEMPFLAIPIRSCLYSISTLFAYVGGPI